MDDNVWEEAIRGVLGEIADDDADDVDDAEASVHDDADDADTDPFDNPPPVHYVVPPTPALSGEFGIKITGKLPPTRRPRRLAGRSRFEWVEALAPLRERPSQWARVLLYGPTEANRRSAQAKAQTLRRLFLSAEPAQYWDFAARRDPETHDWAVYAVFHGLLTPAQQEERERQRRVRAERIARGRARSSLEIDRVNGGRNDR